MKPSLFYCVASEELIMQFVVMPGNHFFIIVCLMAYGVLTTSVDGFAQEKNGRKTTKDRLNEAKQKAIKSITTTQVKDTTMTKKSETGFIPYEGKIIRNILIDHIGFERSVYDTARKKDIDKIARFANNLHHNTREKTIRNNLFIYKNQTLNPYKLADNERYLRDLDFMLDARIVVEPVNGSDSVDIFVITRDVFSLGGSFTLDH